MDAERRSFVWARIGSLVGIVPLGVWTVQHVWDNLAAFRGAEAWESAVTQDVHPATQILLVVFVIGPLVLHTAWGLKRLFTARPNNRQYGYYANLKYLLQRLSAIGVLLFLGAHLWLAWLEPRLVVGHPETFAAISQEMRYHGPTLLVYVLGTLGVAYHLGNGISGFAMSWGVVGSRRGLRNIEPLALGVFAVLLVMSWAAVYALWRGGA